MSQFFGFILLFIFCFLNPPVSQATFFGETQTGVLHLNDEKQPAILFVPPQYKPVNAYPLIIVIGKDGESSDAMIQEWTNFAKRKGFIVLAPSFKRRTGDVPFQDDAWLLKLKKEVAAQYQIAPHRIYLVGKNEGAHYAAYLAVKYPGEFSGAGLLGGSWVGPFEKLMVLQKSPVRQIPFFVSLKVKDSELVNQTVAKAYEFEKKGYPVYLERLEEKEDFASLDFKKRLVDWLEGKSRNWMKVVEESGKKFKEKARTWAEDNVKVE